MLYLFFQKKEMLGVDPFGIHPNIYYRTKKGLSFEKDSPFFAHKAQISIVLFS